MCKTYSCDHIFALMLVRSSESVFMDCDVRTVVSVFTARAIFVMHTDDVVHVAEVPKVSCTLCKRRIAVAALEKHRQICRRAVARTASKTDVGEEGKASPSAGVPLSPSASGAGAGSPAAH